jgi:TonB family protein
MTRFALALGLSLSLHGLAREVVVRLADRPTAQGVVDVEVVYEPILWPARLVPRPSVGAVAHHPRPVASAQTRRRPIPVGSPSTSVIAPTAVVEPGEVPLAAPSAGDLAGPEISGGIAPELDLGAFVERLRRSAQRCSPRRLGPRGEASLARVRFCVGPSGRPEAVTLLQSTGDARLDRAAVECVIPGAAPLPTSDRCLVVPLRFNL